MDTADLSRQQRDDIQLLPLIDYLEGRTYSVPRLFARGLASNCLRRNVLYKKNFSPSGSKYTYSLFLHRFDVKSYTPATTSRPLGTWTTLARVRIRQNYYWPKLAAVVKRYVQTCLDCHRRKPPSVKPAGLLHPVQVPATPFAQVGMDYLGPFPTSTTGNRWIIVATDYLTRYAETGALRRGTAD